VLDFQISHSPFLLDEFDAEFAARVSQADWQQTLEMRDKPNFVTSVLKYHEQLPLQASGKMLLNKLTSEAARYEILGYLLYLFDSRDPEIPRSGLTMTNLEKICTSQNCASPGRVRAMIGVMWAAGHLKRVQSTSDSRIIHFEPTAKLMTIIEGWNHEIFKTIDEVFPDGDLARRHLEEPRFGWNMRKNGIEQVLTGWRPFGLFPEVYHFVAHDAGWMLLIHCVGMMMNKSRNKIIEPISIDLTAFGKKFGVSRSHLRRLLESAFRAGLLDIPPSNGTHILLSRKLVAAYFISMAFELQFYRKHALANDTY
jgi:hypothetical protein